MFIFKFQDQRHIFVSHTIKNVLHKSEGVSRSHRKSTLTKMKPLGQAQEFKLGRGAYCQVYKMKRGELTYAAKEVHSAFVRTMEREELRRFQANFVRECCCSTGHIHLNIVHLMGIYHPGLLGQSFPLAIMELMDENLTAYLEKQNSTFSRKMAILYDVAKGLNYLHTSDPPAIHSSLSTDNVLLKHLPLHPVAKISSLSMTKVLLADAETQLKIIPEGTEFMPPEMFTGDDIHDASRIDVFSYGAVTLHTLCGERPMPTTLVGFDNEKCQTRGFSEVERRQCYLNKMTGGAEELRPLIEACLHNYPDNRPSINEISVRIKPFKVWL